MDESVKKLRLYRFTLEVLDEPMGSDEDLYNEVLEFLESYLEAFHVSLDLVEAADCIGFEADMEMAEA